MQTCQKCGHTRSAEETAPAGQCPSCGVWYVKYAARVARQRAEAAPSPEQSRPTPTQATNKLRELGAMLAWIYGGLFVIAGLMGLLMGEPLAVLYAFSGVAAMPVFWRFGNGLVPKLPGPAVNLVLALGLFLVAFGLSKAKEDRMLAAENQQKAAEVEAARTAAESKRREYLASFNKEKFEIVASVRQHLSEQSYGQALRVLGDWRSVGDPDVVQLEREAIDGFKRAVDVGEPAGFDVVSASKYPELAAAISKGKANQCELELQCATDKHRVEVSIQCTEAIERMAKNSAEWLERAKFPRFRWKSGSPGVITYIGDAVTFQNGFGAKVNMIYECDYRLRTDSVVDVRVQPGRL